MARLRAAALCTPLTAARVMPARMTMTVMVTNNSMRVKLWWVRWEEWRKRMVKK